MRRSWKNSSAPRKTSTSLRGLLNASEAIAEFEELEPALNPKQRWKKEYVQTVVDMEKDLAWIFEKMILLYESHYWLETLYENKFQPVWTEISNLLISVSGQENAMLDGLIDPQAANAINTRGDYDKAERQLDGKVALPSGIQNSMNELSSFKTRWKNNFDSKLVELLPESRKFLLEELNNYVEYHMQVSNTFNSCKECIELFR